MSDATGAIGATITIGGVAIAEVGDITGPEYSLDEVDVTSHDSPGNGEEVLPTLKRWGAVSFPMNSVPSDAGQQDLFAAWEDRAIEPFVLTRTDGITETFNAFVRRISRNAAVTDRNMLDVELRITEAPAVTGDS